MFRSSPKLKDRKTLWLHSNFLCTFLRVDPLALFKLGTVHLVANRVRVLSEREATGVSRLRWFGWWSGGSLLFLRFRDLAAGDNNRSVTISVSIPRLWRCQGKVGVIRLPYLSPELQYPGYQISWHWHNVPAISHWRWYVHQKRTYMYIIHQVLLKLKNLCIIAVCPVR